MNWKQIRKWTAILLPSGVVILLIAAWLIGGVLVAPANRTVGEPPADFPAATVRIESESGATIAGWHLVTPDSIATVVLLHPLRGDRRSMLTRAKLFRDHGYSTLLLDLQAHGESSGKRITLGHLEKHDVLAAVQFIRDISPEQKIVIVGRSLGGASTLFASPDVDAIVLESVYPTVSEAVHNRIQMRLSILHHVVSPLLLVQLKPRLGVSPDQLCPIDQFPQVECPVVIASGDCDKHTSINETRRMFDAANTPKQLVVFEGAEHVDLLAHNPSKYENEIIEYVNKIVGDRIQGTATVVMQKDGPSAF